LTDPEGSVESVRFAVIDQFPENAVDPDKMSERVSVRLWLVVPLCDCVVVDPTTEPVS
jgi:hypothetical protein